MLFGSQNQPQVMRAWHNPFQPPPALYPFTEVVAMMTNSKVLVCSLQMCRADICTPDHDAVRFSVSDPDLLFEELRKAVHAPPFPESTNAVCTQKDDFLIDCHIKGFHCDQKNTEDPKKLPFAKIERISDPEYCQCYTIKPVSQYRVIVLGSTA